LYEISDSITNAKRSMTDIFIYVLNPAASFSPIWSTSAVTRCGSINKLTNEEQENFEDGNFGTVGNLKVLDAIKEIYMIMCGGVSDLKRRHRKVCHDKDH
jgi:hypothetical protein